MTLTVRSASVTGAVTAGRALTHAEMDANWAHVIQSANQNFLPSGILPPNQASRTVSAKLSDVINVLDAKNNDGTSVAGNGVQDDTTGVAAAIASGKKIVFPSGYTFLVSGLTVSTAGQIVEAWGSTIKLKTASSAALLNVNAIGAAVYGGTWDVNNVAQTGINLNVDYCSCQFATLQNCAAIGISGGVNANFLTIQRNTVKDAATYGIFVGGGAPSADLIGNKIIDNDVDTSGTATAYGIYLVGKTDGTTFFQKRWNVSRNRVNGTTNGGATTVGITVRGIDGVYQGNQVTGYLLQHSLDITSRSTISGNRGTNPTSTGNTLGLEILGGHNAITGNYLNGHYRGISITGTATLDYNTISGNTIENASNNAIYVDSTGGGTAKHLTITGNTIDQSAATSGNGIYLADNVTNVLIATNTIIGRGSGVALRGVYLDTLAAAPFVSLLSNRFIGWQRACTVYNGGVVTYTDLSAVGNDLSNDVGSPSNLFNAEGSAVLGTRTSQVCNIDSTGGAPLLRARLLIAQAASANAANNLTLGTDGNYFPIAGATQINLINNASWSGGAQITLKFASTPTVKHNQAASGTNKPIILNGAADFVAAANNTLTLVYDATDAVWYEVARKV